MHNPFDQLAKKVGKEALDPSGPTIVHYEIAELAALPEDAHERTVAEGIVVHLQDRLARKPGRTPEEEELIVTIRGGFNELKAQARDEGLKEGRQEGRKEGRQEGRQEGRKEGRAAEAARAVLTVLRVRGLGMSETARERIMAEKDLERLERWHERAILAASVSEVIDEPT